MQEIQERKKKTLIKGKLFFVKFKNLDGARVILRKSYLRFNINLDNLSLVWPNWALVTHETVTQNAKLRG